MGARQFRPTGLRTACRCVLVATVLICVGWQHAAIVAAQAVVSCRARIAASASHETECHCGTGSHASCPMHRRAPTHHSNTNDHFCTGCDHPSPVIVTGASVDVGSLPAARFQVLPPAECDAPMGAVLSALVDTGHRPVVPPPRS